MKRLTTEMRVTCLLYQRGTWRALADMYVLVTSAPIPKRAGTIPYKAIWSIKVRLAAIVAKGKKELTIELVKTPNVRDGAAFCWSYLETEGRTLKLA